MFCKGSGNYTAWYLNGTKCPVTAALRIVMGHCVSTNIVSLHQGNKCSGYSGLILGFGLFGDVMRDCEKYRWMGTSRFKGKLIFMNNKQFSTDQLHVITVMNFI